MPVKIYINHFYDGIKLVEPRSKYIRKSVEQRDVKRNEETHRDVQHQERE